MAIPIRRMGTFVSGRCASAEIGVLMSVLGGCGVGVWVGQILIISGYPARPVGTKGEFNVVSRIRALGKVKYRMRFLCVRRLPVGNSGGPCRASLRRATTC